MIQITHTRPTTPMIAYRSRPMIRAELTGPGVSCPVPCAVLCRCPLKIIANLYHAFPSHRILLVTHSNAALNDLFAKIRARDIDQRHLLRLGAGQRELEVPWRSVIPAWRMYTKPSHSGAKIAARVCCPH
jgi:hypothetical protein